MLPRSLLAIAGLLGLMTIWSAPPARGPSDPARPAAGPLLSESSLLAIERENGCVDGPGEGGPASWPDWASATIAGGDVPPARVVSDPHPILHSVAVDAQHDRVFVSDPNRHAIWSYDRRAASKGDEVVVPLTGIRGPATGMMFVAAVTVDPAAREVYTVDNDIGDRLVVFPYEASGNARPKRVLSVPHQAWGISIDRQRDEMAITVEGAREVVVYRRAAKGSDAPLRIIRGPKTGLGDPHGVFFDGAHGEIVVANHGNQGGRQPAPGDAPRSRRAGPLAPGSGAFTGGRFEPPSITVYPAEARGDVAPVRRIQGPATGLDWPMAIDLDAERNEIAVANNGDSSILIFRRTDSGDAAPVRVIKGPRTGVHGPMGVAIDTRNDELWVSNYGDHTALVFARTASGDVAPERVLRNAPAGSPTGGFGNPGAVAYDPKRDEILVPN